MTQVHFLIHFLYLQVILTKPDDNTADLSENGYRFSADRDAAGFYTCSASNGDTDFTQSEKLLVHCKFCDYLNFFRSSLLLVENV